MSIFPFIDPAFDVKFKSSLPNPRFRGFSPEFLKSSYSFTFYRFIRSRHFGFIFIGGLGVFVLFSALWVSSCCSSMISWKGCLSFLHWIAFVPLSKISCACLWSVYICGGCFWVFSSVSLMYVSIPLPIPCRLGYCSNISSLKIE